MRVITQSARASGAHPNEVRIAFDDDALLFSYESERVCQRDGPAAFQSHERDHAGLPPAHERAIRTLMDWQIDVDEAMFLGGLPKGEFLREFEPDFFFDDQTGHIDNAATHVPAGHVAAGVSNG